MSHHLEDVNFPSDAFHIADILDFLFVKNFDSHFLLSVSVYPLLNFSKCTLPKCLHESIIANLFFFKSTHQITPVTI